MIKDNTMIDTFQEKLKHEILTSFNHRSNVFCYFDLYLFSDKITELIQRK